MPSLTKRTHSFVCFYKRKPNCSVVQANMELRTILLLPKYWDYRHEQPMPYFQCLRNDLSLSLEKSWPYYIKKVEELAQRLRTLLFFLYIRVRAPAPRGSSELPVTPIPLFWTLWVPKYTHSTQTNMKATYAYT